MSTQLPEMPVAYNDEELLKELEPRAEELLERHLTSAKEWFPHKLVPWSRGRDFEPDYEWDPEAFELPAAVRSALFLNLLTEDNLPYYFQTIERIFGGDTAWDEWTRRWTAEEGRHSIVIRDYLTVTRAIDPIHLERARMAQVSKGETPQPLTVAEALIYLTLQELATRVSHLNTGKALKSADPAGYDIMKRVAMDENLHFLYYRDSAAAALEFDPSSLVIAIARQVRTFHMPGTGIEDFAHHSRVVAKAGIYDYQIYHDDVIVPMVNGYWRIDELSGLTPKAEAAREGLQKYLARLGRIAASIQSEKATDL